MDLCLGMVQPTGEIAGILPNIGDGGSESLLDQCDLCSRRGIRVNSGNQLVQQAEPGELPHVVRHRNDRLPQFIKLFDRARVMRAADCFRIA